VTQPDTGLLDELVATAADDGVTRIVVGALITRPDGAVLLLHRVLHDYLGGMWELPSGGIEDGEDLPAALRREVAEETGLAVTGIGEYLGSFDYLSASGRLTRQHTFAATAEGTVAVSAEHDQAAWYPIEDAKRLASLAVRDVLTIWQQKRKQPDHAGSCCCYAAVGGGG
jgi:8-oxo-dGTP diphosphatase